MKTPRIGRSLRSFIKRYGPERAYVVNLELMEKIREDKTEVRFLPFYELINWTGGKEGRP